MARATPTQPLDAAGARSRLQEAHAYIAAAELLQSGTPAEYKVAASNAILAGIAAADAIGGLVLGLRSAGDDHASAVTLIRRATHPATKASNSLRRLLSEKTPVQYGATPITASDSAQFLKWARDVVEEADKRASL